MLPTEVKEGGAGCTLGIQIAAHLPFLLRHLLKDTTDWSFSFCGLSELVLITDKIFMCEGSDGTPQLLLGRE